jgi:hypothetical protein
LRIANLIDCVDPNSFFAVGVLWLVKSLSAYLLKIALSVYTASMIFFGGAMNVEGFGNDRDVKVERDPFDRVDEPPSQQSREDRTAQRMQELGLAFGVAGIVSVVADAISSTSTAERPMADQPDSEDLSQRTALQQELSSLKKLDVLLESGGRPGIVESARNLARQLQDGDVGAFERSLAIAHLAGGNPGVSAFADLVNQQLNQAGNGFKVEITSMSRGFGGGGSYSLSTPFGEMPGNYPENDVPMPDRGGDEVVPHATSTTPAF